MPQNQNPQWNQSLEGWRPKNFQQLTLMLPPKSNNTIQNSAPPKQPQIFYLENSNRENQQPV
jgi:hypothetical protein